MTPEREALLKHPRATSAQQKAALHALLAIRFDTMAAELETILRNWRPRREKDKRVRVDVRAAIEDVRDALRRGNGENAAALAFRLGALVGDIARGRRQGRQGGTKTGKQKTIAADALAEQIRAAMDSWGRSDELQDQHRTAAAYAAKHLRIAPRTVARHRKRTPKGQ